MKSPFSVDRSVSTVIFIPGGGVRKNRKDQLCDASCAEMVMSLTPIFQEAIMRED
jgi:hypothetical protein